jgi:hypothetical protein
VNISDEAVEAAALALLERDYGVNDWGITDEQVKAAYLDEARTALEAAAPHIAAEAWDEGWQKAHSCDDPAMAGIFFNPYRS